LADAEDIILPDPDMTDEDRTTLLWLTMARQLVPTDRPDLVQQIDQQIEELTGNSEESDEPEDDSPNGAYTWPCVGGCGEMTNGSQFCCRTYCSNPSTSDQEAESEEDNQSASSESTKSEKKFRWADEADEAERRDLCEYSDGPTDDEEDVVKDGNAQKQIEYIIPNDDASQSPVLYSCTSDEPVEILWCSGPRRLPSAAPQQRIEFDAVTTTFDEEYAEEYAEMYGDCEDKKEEQSYSEQADEEEAFTDEEQRRFWEKVGKYGSVAKYYEAMEAKSKEPELEEEQSYGDQADEEAAFTDEEEDWARAGEDSWPPWDA